MVNYFSKMHWSVVCNSQWVNLVDLSVDDVDLTGSHSRVGSDDDEVVASNRARRSKI